MSQPADTHAPQRPPQNVRMLPHTTRRHLLQAGLAITLAGRTARAADPAAAPQEGRWRDDRRQRNLPWLLRLPATPGPWPLVLYSHGLGGNRHGGRAWGEAWADAGVAVLHLQHPGSDSDTLRGGLQALRAAGSAEQMIERLQDLRFAIAQLVRLAAEPLWRDMRLDALGVAGHSFGAVTTQAVAGQRYPAVGDLSDPRPKAFVALSPSLPVGLRLSAQEAFGGITRPFLAVTGSLDGSVLGRDQAAEQRAAVYDGLPPGQRALLWLDGADHMTFGGGRGAGPGDGLGDGNLQGRRPAAAQDRQAAHTAVVARITALWWRAHLQGDAEARAALSGPQGLAPPDRFTLG